MQDWQNLIENDMKSKLIDEFQKLQIIVEADLQSSICMYLRDFIDRHNNPRWRVFNQMFQISDAGNNTSIHPDILLTQQGKRKIAIELKQAAARHERVPFPSVIADVEKMGNYGKKYDMKTYVIYTCYQPPHIFEQHQNELKEKAEIFGKHQPKLICVNVYGSPQHSEWYTKLRKHMELWTELYNEGENNV